VRRIKNRFQPRVPKALFVRRGPIRCPAGRARPATHGTLRARRTQRNKRRGGAGPTRQRLGRSTAAYVAMVQLPGRGTVALATASIDARTAGMERELRGRATAALFDICADIHPRSIRPLPMRFPIYNRSAPFISHLLFHNERPLSAVIRHLQRGEAVGMAPLVGQSCNA
jgi:hypothetical protein